MIPWTLLDTSPIPGDGGDLRLFQRGAEFSIRLGTNELMNSRLSGSEEALATLACAKLGSDAPSRILIGGLGMGFTLAAARKSVGRNAQIVVAELVPAVVAWARGPLSSLCGESLSDPRVSIHEGDVAGLIRSQRAAFDVILLDVDNGPDGLTRKANDWLYGLEGLTAARSALRSNGILAVWSAAPDRKFTQRLRNVGFAVEERRARASRTGGGAHHTIWLATVGQRPVERKPVLKVTRRK